jgi:hypothetical protein
VHEELIEFILPLPHHHRRTTLILHLHHHKNLPPTGKRALLGMLRMSLRNELQRRRWMRLHLTAAVALLLLSQIPVHPPDGTVGGCDGLGAIGGGVRATLSTTELAGRDTDSGLGYM